MIVFLITTYSTELQHLEHVWKVSIHRNFWCNIFETKSRKVMDVLPGC